MENGFYFVRHGQTDYNILEGVDKGDHPGDIPLNLVGRRQAESIEPLIAGLPIQTVCLSPHKRVVETEQIITSRLVVPRYQIEEFKECSASVWKSLRQLSVGMDMPEEENVRQFFDRVKKGIEKVLSYSNPLVVAHGGVHFAICFLLKIEEYDPYISNCGVAHFSLEQQNWKGKRHC